MHTAIPTSAVTTITIPFSALRAARIAAGCSLAKAAVLAGCAQPTARAYELCPESVQPSKRKALAEVYSQFTTRKSA